MSRRLPQAHDPRGQHMRLYCDIFDSAAWRCLSATDQRCYLALLRQCGSTNNGDLSLPFSMVRHYGIRSQSTLAKSLRAVRAVGLIAVTRKGGCQRGGQRLATLYRLTDRDCYERRAKLIEECKVTNEWKNVSSIAMGRALIRKLEEAEAEQAAARNERKAVK